MPFDSTSIMTKGARMRAKWLTDLYDALTGVMVDQDITFGRNVTIRGALSTIGAQLFVAATPSSVPLAAQGILGQGTSLFELRDSNSVILFSVDQNGVVVKPRINDFSLANHGHANIVGGTAGGPIAAAAIQSSMLGIDVQRSNLLSNGSLDFWSGGAGPFTANGATLADNWKINLAGTDALSVTRSSVNADVAGQYCAQCAYTVGTPTVPSTAIYQTLDQYVLRGKVVTVTFRVRSAVANVCRPFIFDGFNVARVYGNFHSGSGAYELVTVTTTINAATTSAPLVGLEFNNTSGTYQVDNAMLVIGSAPADFVPNLPVPSGVTNAGLTSDTARANLLTNGGFEVWQRGTLAITANGAYTADRWSISLNNADTLSVARNTANADVGSVACAACTFVLVNGAGSTSLQQPLRITVDGPALATRTVTLSMRVKTSTANAVRINLSTDGFVVNAYSAFHSGSGAYETLTVSATLQAAATTLYAIVYFAASTTAYLDNAMLVVGSVAADYAPLHPADDLARCQRYYELVGLAGGLDVQVYGYTAATSHFSTVQRWRAVKPAVPTVTKVGTWAVTNCAQPTILTPTVEGCSIDVLSTALGALSFYNSAGNVTVESNP